MSFKILRHIIIVVIFLICIPTLGSIDARDNSHLLKGGLACPCGSGHLGPCLEAATGRFGVLLILFGHSKSIGFCVTDV